MTATERANMLREIGEAEARKWRLQRMLEELGYDASEVEVPPETPVWAPVIVEEPDHDE